MKSSRISLIWQVGAAGIIGFAAVGWAGTGSGPSLVSTVYQYVSTAGQTDCAIKGNISISTGERIYHTPGQQFYNQTRIDIHRGERWFCSEQDARQAGWRRSKR